MASPNSVLQDCVDGSLDGSHSDADKREALDQIPADVDEYSDCRSVIRAAIGGGSKGGDGPGGSAGGAGASTPEARKAATQKAKKVREARLRKARERREKQLGPRAVDPRDTGVFHAANTANGMPLPLTLALIALGLIALTGALLTLWRRNPAFADAVRRVTPAHFRR